MTIRERDERTPSLGVSQSIGRRAATLDERGAAPVLPDTRAAWRWPIWPLFLIGFVLLCLGLLIGPRVPDADAGYNCVGNVALEGPFGFALNCDSPEFMWLARDPAGLLNHLNSRQSRPGLILLAAAIEAPLSLIVPPEGPPVPIYQGLYDPPRVAQSFIQDEPAYFAYILLNLAILLASFHVMRRAIEQRQPARNGAEAIILVAAGLLLVANDVTKAFFWSPHTQMFNILVPVVAVYATQRVVVDARLERRLALALGTLIGLGMITYPAFIVVPACVLPPALLGLFRAPSARARGRDLASLALMLLLAVIPAALWYVFLRLTAGHMFYAELSDNEVVWMKDALAHGVGTFLAGWFGNLGQLVAMAAPQALALTALVGWLGFTFVRAARRGEIEDGRVTAALPMVGTGLYVSFAMLGFYTCVGWMAPRLAFPMLPPLVAAAGATALLLARRLPPGPRTVLAGGCLAIAAAQIVYEVAKQGPWS